MKTFWLKVEFNTSAPSSHFIFFNRYGESYEGHEGSSASQGHEGYEESSHEAPRHEGSSASQGHEGYEVNAD